MSNLLWMVQFLDAHQRPLDHYDHPVDFMAEADSSIRTAQERLHRQIGQWARVAHRRVRESASKARKSLGLEDRTYRPRWLE